MRRYGLYLVIPIAGLVLSAMPLSSCGLKVQGTDGDDDASEEVGDDDDDMTYFEPTPTNAPVPQFEISISPAALKFGSVEVSTGRTLQLTYTNQGSQIVHLDQLVMNSSTPYFTNDPLSKSQLEPGESLVVPVTFRPANVGTYNAVLSLVTEETNIPSATLNGRGVNPAAALPE